ncbi:PQQ-binding-like beta-propeller repeat protein [Streptomyces sp. NPDC006458]|uniref:PQQ-binding-like beta-propeller repeat protein n=1 Tax=Streptomyces sp. NPDC006458 TaxID=3154302 RepID=UPI0033A5E910
MGDGVVFVALQDGRVLGLRPDDGSVRWTTDLRGSLTRATVVKGHALVSLSRGQDEGVLVAVDGRGVTRWTLETNGWPWFQTAGPHDMIYAVTSSGWLYRTELATGRRNFAQKIAGLLHEVVAANNLLYLSTQQDGLIALDPAKGTPQWTHRTKGFVSGAAADSDQVYFTVGHGTDESSYGGQLVALTAWTGEKRWTVTFDSLVQVGPTLAGGQLLVTDNRGTLHAFGAADGERIWQQDVSADVSSRVAHDGETVYAGTSRGVTALNLRTGDIAWSEQVLVTPPSSSYGSTQPVIDSDTVYLAYGDRTVDSTDCVLFAFSR